MAPPWVQADMELPALSVRAPTAAHAGAHRAWNGMATRGLELTSMEPAGVRWK